MNEAVGSIKRFRVLKNVTREQMADRLGMSLSGYSKLERGDVDITLTKLYKVAEVLEVSVSQILNFDTSQILDVSNNQVVNGVEVREQQRHYPDEYKDKYISLLENEVERLKRLKKC